MFISHTLTGRLIATFVLIVIFAFALGRVTSPTPNTSGMIASSFDYADFQAKAKAKASNPVLITIAWTPSMEVLDDNFYLFVERDEQPTEYHTFAVSGFGSPDARTNTGCYRFWPFDGRSGTKGYNEAFCVSDVDMEWMFSNGRAYFLAYPGN